MDFVYFAEFVATNQTICGALAVCITLIVFLISTKFIFRNMPQDLSKEQTEIYDKQKSDSHNGEATEQSKEAARYDKDLSPNDEVKAAGDSDDASKPDYDIDDDVDPVEFCEHIQSEVKKARHRVATREIQQKLTPEEIEAEREIQRKQLEEIFRLMEQQNDKFGVSDVDDIREQMKLYA